MEQQYPQSTVVFRNVGQLYFPQTRVECHYSVTSAHEWSSSDWIGIFKVGWSSLQEYHTYSWSLVPEGYTKGSAVDCCALFQACYLPRPSPVEYQFVYVDKLGKVCAHSRPYTFCSPKPLEELETLKEEQDGDEEDGDEEELLLVVPRAQLLQSQLEECVREKAELQQAVEEERRSSRRAKEEWESERKATEEEISELLEKLNHKCDVLKNVEGQHLDVKSSHQNLNSELGQLLVEKVQSQRRIKDLEDGAKALAYRETERHVEMERLKEMLKKTSSQIKLDEEKKKLLKAESEAALAEVCGLQHRLESSERLAESLRRELRELSTRQGHANAELHQVRLQVAQLGLQLSEEKLLLREERANWVLEREAYRQAAEANQKKVEELNSEVQRKKEQLREERNNVEFGMKYRDCDGDNKVQTVQRGQKQQRMLAGLVDPVVRIPSVALEVSCAPHFSGPLWILTASLDPRPPTL
ncbi:calcium-binding and coiled-coil domain-containing protein 1b isoform X2 [Entelurus aequoreus]|uniref:calcium-binding and coiled-coil domain-containing protein 1b isoform X2 n=1 Tax=Entelurus aequoreus TaxID=161455 RepID=UPI002B1D82C9|nr:calcium-binding and coiled-coil domain-containing protein 1b isoform X2 [Entelurus aequoreus]